MRYDRLIITASFIWNNSPKRHSLAGNGRKNAEKRRRGISPKAQQRSQSRPGAITAFFEGGTRRLFQRHPSVGVRVRGTAFSGDGGLPGGEVPLLRCDGRNHPACVIMTSAGRAGQQPAPAPLAHALSRTLKMVSIHHHHRKEDLVESGAPLNADRHLRMNVTS